MADFLVYNITNNDTEYALFRFSSLLHSHWLYAKSAGWNYIPNLVSFAFSCALKIVGWKQERSISARRVRPSHLGSARKIVPSRVLRVLTLSRDGTFLRVESRWDVLTR